MALVEKHNSRYDISLLEIYSDDEVMKKPLVLLFHGYLMSKEIMAPLGRLLAQNGYFSVAIDAYRHGERKNGNTAPSLFESCIYTSHEIDRIIDFYNDNRRVDNSKVGLLGVSMGGMISFDYLSQGNSRACAAAIMFSTPDWYSVLSNKLVVDFYKAAIGYTAELNEREKQLCKVRQPLARYNQIKDIPLIMFNGDADLVIPISEVQNAYKLIKGNYVIKDRIKMIVYPGVGHGCAEDSGEADDVNTQTIQWFDRFLK